MRYDVVIVTYNSEQWLGPCVRALAATGPAAAGLHLIFVDNASQDGTLQALKALQGAHSFGGFTVLPQGKNRGFSAGCNAGAAAGNAPCLLFLNADTEVQPGCFAALDEAIDAEPASTAAFECRQLPFETGHHLHPATLASAWASGAALVVRRAAFEAIGGFDERLFMYCEDVDLSWRLRAAGYTLRYVPGAEVVHHTYALDEGGQPQIKLGEYAGGLYSGLLLRYKYGRLSDILRGERAYLRALRRPQHFPGVRRLLAKNYLRHFGRLWGFWFWRFAHRDVLRARVANLDSYAPDRGIFALKKPAAQPLVSVVVRTCARPDTLRCTLQSLTHQTYPNFEVVVVEDGAATSEAECAEFADLRLRYHATGEKVGRSRAGNLGLTMAAGTWCNFLDDDDFFYPDHLELLVGEAEANPGCELVSAAAMVAEVDVTSRTPYEVDVKRIYPMRYDRLDNMTLCVEGRIPIQSVLFKKALFERYGGLNEQLDGNEDWSMWLRYFASGKRIHESRVDIPRATSLYLVPADGAAAHRREQQYSAFEAAMLDDESVRFEVSPRQMRQYYEDTLADLRHLRNLGELDAFLDGEPRKP